MSHTDASASAAEPSSSDMEAEGESLFVNPTGVTDTLYRAYLPSTKASIQAWSLMKPHPVNVYDLSPPQLRAEVLGDRNEYVCSLNAIEPSHAAFVHALNYAYGGDGQEVLLSLERPMLFVAQG